MGTLDIQVRPEADEQAILQLVYQKLEGLTGTDSISFDGQKNQAKSELTVSIIKL